MRQQWKLPEFEFGIDVLGGFSANVEIGSFYVPQPRVAKKTITDNRWCVAGSTVNGLAAYAANGLKARGLLTLATQDDDHPENEFINGFISSVLTRLGLDHRIFMWRTGTSPNSPLKIRMTGSGEREVQYYPYKPPYDPEKVREGLHLIAEDVLVHRPKVRLASGVRLADTPLVESFFTTNHVPSLRVLNPGTDLLQQEQALLQMLALTDLLVLNHQELGFLFTTLNVSSVDQLFDRDLGPIEILVTEDVKGATLLSQHNQPLHQSAYQIDAIDPTGAGDCFLSHFITARLTGKDDGEALRFAAAAAAVQTTMHGGSAVPPADMIDQLLREGTLHPLVSTNSGLEYWERS